MKKSTQRPTTASKSGSRDTEDASPILKVTFFKPAASARCRAVTRSSALVSMPTMVPSRPTMSATMNATSPAPLPTSRTFIPGKMPASSKTRFVYGPNIFAWRSSRSVSVCECPKRYVTFGCAPGLLDPDARSSSSNRPNYTLPRSNRFPQNRSGTGEIVMGPVDSILNTGGYARVVGKPEVIDGPSGQVPISRVVSRGRSNTGLESILRSLKAQRFSGTLIQTQCDFVQLRLRVAGQIRLLGQVLP